MPAKKKAILKKKESPKKAESVKMNEAEKECDHCLGTGKCTAGEPYDKGHHQMFDSKVFLTSCIDCLEAAGEHRNSKKLVKCHFCDGTGKVKA